MNNTYRSTLKEPTNLSLPCEIVTILEKDAYYFRFIKHGEPNINGFLNFLIPILSDYQDNLHSKVLEYHNGDREKAREIEQTIHDVYNAPFDCRYDGVTTVPFRVNKSSYEHFLKIHDSKLRYYNTSFLAYIRRLLTEYATKAIDQREYIVHFREMKVLEDAIINGVNCIFRCHEEVIEFVPVVYELSPNNRRVIIAGLTYDKETIIVLKLSSVICITQGEEKIEVTDRDISAVCDTVFQYFQKEEEEEGICMA